MSFGLFLKEGAEKASRRLLKKIQMRDARKIDRAETYLQYVAARRLSGNECVFQQPAKRRFFFPVLCLLRLHVRARR
jgi:hypothetical protein